MKLKMIIWLAALLGLLPVLLCAIVHLISMISSARLRRDPFSFVGDIFIQLDSSSKLHLSTQLWPSVVVVAGALAVLVGLVFLLPKQPDLVHSGGFSRMESYIDRLLRSPKEFASVIIATPDGEHGLLVMRQAGRTVLCVSANRTKNDGGEARMREFFTRLGMTPVRDYLSANDGVEKATLNLEFQLTGDARTIGRLCVSIFTDLFGTADQHGLEFTTDGL